MTSTHERVVAAINFLVEAPKYSSLTHEMTRIIERWDTHPMYYSGHLACLNAMIDVGLRSRHAFERLVELVERSRRGSPVAKRKDYQRDLMRERRARVAKALDLHERRYGQLRGAARLAETQAIQERWNVAKCAFMAGRGEMSWNDRLEATQEFWSKIDAQLDANFKSATRLRREA